MEHPAQTLEAKLPDPKSLLQSIILEDDLEQFPTEALQLINDFAVLEYLIPASQQGQLKSIFDLLLINRVLSRRNLTAAIAIGQSFLGALPIWIAGTLQQKLRLAEILRSGGLNCLALTEELFGSDLQSTQTNLQIHDKENYKLSGTKWCINNATRGGALSLLARSHPSGGEQGFSLVFIDKASLPADEYSFLARLKTHGLRGADISGIRFDNCLIAASSLIGREGTGLRTTFQTMQISRTLCAGFSLGAGDTCLRLAIDFASQRQLYGASVAKIGSIRSKLANSYRQLLLCEGIAWTIARACTLLPEQMSIYSAIVKYFIPLTVDTSITECGVVLGARGYLRETPYALFQKMKRDHAVVALFDGSSEVNLFVISGQLRSLFLKKSASKAYALDWSHFYDLAYEAPPFEGEGLKLSNRGHDFIWEGLPTVLQHADADIQTLARVLQDQYRQLQDDFASLDEALEPMSTEIFAFSKSYCALTAKALYLQFWWVNRRQFNAHLSQTAWLKAVLGLQGEARGDDEGFLSLAEQYQSQHMFSHLPFSIKA